MGLLRRLLGLSERREEDPPVEEVAHAPAAGHNLLVVSDTHLGELSKDRSRIAYLKASSVLDREFCDLLEHYLAHSPGGRPWRLVLGGDIVDFLQVTMVPRRDLARREYGFDVSATERRVGLDNGPAKVRWKLQRVMDRHRVFFTFLADFVGRGNEVVIVRGNHDAEFFWGQVHQAFRERLVRIYFADERIEGESPEEFAARIQFHPWFYYEPELLYFEHGHQYDEYSCLEHLLYPVLPWDHQRMEWPAVSLAVRWVVNLMSGFKTHEKDEWTFLDYFRWMATLRTRQIPRLLRAYVRMCQVTLGYWLQRRRSDARPLAELHAQVRRTIAQESGLPEETLDAIEALQRRPVHLTLGGSLNLTFIDRWSLIAADIAAVAALAVAGASWPIWLGAVPVLGLANWWLLRWMGARMDTWPVGKLREAARRIHDLVGTRYVVMGHSHAPEVVQIGHAGACYVNIGSWLHYEGVEPHPPGECDCGLTHLVMAGEDEAPPEAELRRWCVQQRAPVPWVRREADPT